jgi:hypothetical protein
LGFYALLFWITAGLFVAVLVVGDYAITAPILCSTGPDADEG